MTVDQIAAALFREITGDEPPAPDLGASIRLHHGHMPRFYGGAAAFWRYRGPEAILSGPFDTGKTFAGLYKLHALCLTYPGAQAFMARAEYTALRRTAIVTYETKVLPVSPDHPDCPVTRYGGKQPEYYFYPNGSSILCAGLDKPGRLLSGEFDYGYVPQAEEISLDAWETMTTRASGRSGNAPYTQLMGDCNPAHPQHWILHRAPLKRFEQLHRHNPAIYDPETGDLTAAGAQRMAVLERLTGLRRKRGLLGLWVSAEGVVYEDFDPGLHVWPADRPLPKFRARAMSIDYGYTNPFVAQWWGIDGDGRLYLYREIYMSQRTVRAHCDEIKRLECGLTKGEWAALSEESREQKWRIDGERITTRVADHDAEDRATMRENGLHTKAAKKDIKLGIEKVQERLAAQGDGLPRLFVVENACVEYDPELYREYPGDLHPCCTEHEFPVYVWHEEKEGKPRKEQPVDNYNHGMDATRYMVMELDKGQASMSRGAARGLIKRRSPNLGRRPR